jgi:Protein of unknown function (DUF3253)
VASRPKDTDAELERTILSLLDDRAQSSTICPSDAARAVGTADSWRSLMDPARDAARRLVEAGEVVITQGGEVVDLDSARGPIRIRRRTDR